MASLWRAGTGVHDKGRGGKAREGCQEPAALVRDCDTGTHGGVSKPRREKKKGLKQTRGMKSSRACSNAHALPMTEFLGTEKGGR